MSITYECDNCGKIAESQESKQEFLHIRKRFGYYSDGFDEVLLEVDLCPACVKKIFKEML